MKPSSFHPVLLFLAMPTLLSNARADDNHLAYPPTRRVDHVDIYSRH